MALETGNGQEPECPRSSWRNLPCQQLEPRTRDLHEFQQVCLEPLSLWSSAKHRAGAAPGQTWKEPLRAAAASLCPCRRVSGVPGGWVALQPRCSVQAEPRRLLASPKT